MLQQTNTRFVLSYGRLACPQDKVQEIPLFGAEIIILISGVSHSEEQIHYMEGILLSGILT